LKRGRDGQDEHIIDCVICTDPLDPAVDFTCLGCNNSCCHLACLQQWARHAPTCPLCRARLPRTLWPPNTTQVLQRTLLETIPLATNELLRTDILHLFVAGDDAEDEANALATYTIPFRR